MAVISGNPYLAGNPYARASADPSSLVNEFAHTYFDPQLAKLGLSEEAIEHKDLDDLESALKIIDDAIDHPQQFGELKASITAEGSIVLVTDPNDSLLEITALPILLDLKTRILRRINILRPRAQLTDLKDAIETQVKDSDVQGMLLKLIDQSVNQAEGDANRLAETEKALDKSAEEFARDEHKMKMRERVHQIRKSWFTRDTIAAIIGAVLLLGLGISLVVAMFIGTTTSEVVTSGFLLILGYFFGQATTREKGE